MVSVPGRIGDVASDTGSFDNVAVEYTVVITDDLRETLRALNAILFLSENSGKYRRLEDSRYPDEFRMAVAKTALAPHVSGELGKYRLTLTCKAQVYLVEGETESTYSSNTSITTEYRGRPIIRATYANTSQTMVFYVGDTKFEMYSCGYRDVYFDCEERTAYNGATSLTKYLHLSGEHGLNVDYPELTPGQNSIRLVQNCSQIKITPRWWCL